MQLSVESRDAAAGCSQLPDLQAALDAAASVVAGSRVLAGAVGRGEVALEAMSNVNSSSKDSSSNLMAGIGGVRDAESAAARGKLLELLCRAVHTEVWWHTRSN
jgi:hypothetical protein